MRPVSGRWYAVGLLGLLYALSMIDRFILALLAAPVTASLGLSDVQMGLLLGAGFALLYSAAGIPLAHAIDRGDRRWIVIAGVTLWSATTIASAFANSFEALLACRAGVAIGEAVLTPAAISMIADLFGRHERALPTSAYMAVSSVMATGAFIVGAAALDLAGGLTGAFSLEAWRITLLIVGAPGLVLAAVAALTLREPARVDEPGTVAAVSAADFVRYLKAGRRAYVPFFLGVGAISTLTFAIIAWATTLLVRSEGLATADAGYLFGAIGLPAGLVGTFAWPWLAARLERRGQSDGTILTMIGCVAAATLAVLAIGLAGSLAVTIAGLAVAMLTLPVITVLSSIALQSLGPGRLRARLVALNLLVVNLFGYTVGPLFIAVVAERAFAGPDALARGLAVLAAVAGPAALACFIGVRRSFGALVAARDA